MYHFWYSEAAERREYENFAFIAECNHISSLDIPRLNKAVIKVNGEKTVVAYNLCSNDRHAYDEECWQGVADKIYLGQGQIFSLHQMTTEEIINRMRELDMIIPSALQRKV